MQVLYEKLFVSTKYFKKMESRRPINHWKKEYNSYQLNFVQSQSLKDVS